jgi:pyruvate carboxylase subunit B
MANYYMPPEAKSVEPLIPFSPMPGGALTSNTQMMRDSGILDRYAEVAAAMEEVVARGGYATSVTPVSQFYFQQAFNNVMVGPWKKIAEGYGKMVLGYFGKTPEDPDPEIVELAREQLALEPTTEKPVDLNDADPGKGIKPAKAMLEEAGLPQTDENVFIAATCKDKGITFLKGEAVANIRKKTKEPAGSPGGGTAARGTAAGVAADTYTVTVNGRGYNVRIDGDTAMVDGAPYAINVTEGRTPQNGRGGASAAPAGGGSTPASATPAGEAARAAPAATAESVSVPAPLPGIVLRLSVGVGDNVQEGDVLLVLESMKMENPLPSPASGTVQEIKASPGDQVAAEQILVTIGR